MLKAAQLRITHLLTTKKEQPILLRKNSVGTLATIAHNIFICTKMIQFIFSKFLHYFVNSAETIKKQLIIQHQHQLQNRNNAASSICCKLQKVKKLTDVTPQNTLEHLGSKSTFDNQTLLPIERSTCTQLGQQESHDVLWLPMHSTHQSKVPNEKKSIRRIQNSKKLNWKTYSKSKPGLPI